MGLLQVLKVSIPASGGGTAKEYYFQGGSVYSNADIATATGISRMMNPYARSGN
jgi:hypothetical protein